MIRSCPAVNNWNCTRKRVKHGQTISLRPSAVTMKLGFLQHWGQVYFSTHPQEGSTKFNKSMNCEMQYLRERSETFCHVRNCFETLLLQLFPFFPGPHSPHRTHWKLCCLCCLRKVFCLTVAFECFWDFRSSLWKQIETLSLWSLLSLDSAVQSLAWPTETQHADTVFGCWSVWFWSCFSSSASANLVSLCSIV